MPSTPTISASQLKARLQARTGELAVLDVGEEGEYGEGHLLRAVHAPYSLLEGIVPALVPRLACPVVLVDHGHGMAARAAQRMQALGYSQVRVLDGGTLAWQRSGFELFKGVFVPSKAYGEWAERALAIPSIDAAALERLRASGRPVAILDPRTLAEHAARHVPHAIGCPGAELPYRFDDLVPDPGTPVVLACGGRTRGLVGAQTLRDAGLPNPVAALADGNHGWQLAGFALEEGLRHRFPDAVSAAGLHRARARAARQRQAQAIESIGTQTLRRWTSAQESAARTTYVLDVRTPEEFERGHWPQARLAPGGQLLQATDRWLATLGARVVLVDAEGVRATSVALHLKRMGWDACVFELGHEQAGAEAGARRGADRDWATGAEAADAAARVDVDRAEVASPVPQITPCEAWEMLRAAPAGAARAVALDLGPSTDFLRASAQGPGWRAHWASRARLRPWCDEAAQGRPLVLFSADGHAARLAARDLAEAAGPARVRVVEGGLRAWRHAGYPVAATPEDGLDPGDRLDVLYWARSRRHGDREAMRLYLEWERQLLAQVRRDEPDFPCPANRPDISPRS